jgi:2-polyprenyl-3-methyl-5-hydroxy-6-metoxy-1,4-benzoquinol methylase
MSAITEERSVIHPASPGAKKMPSILVAVASYGTKQDHFLRRVVAEYRKLSMPCRIVVLSDRPKPVDDAEVLVGLPSPNPYSLPFAHRRLFAENVDNYDLFIYTEDDTLLTSAHIDAFLDIQRHLREDEILGFIRSETAPNGERYITTIHRHFRWLPETVDARGDELVVQLSNQHSGCFMATRAQLKRALASGGFLVEPHDGVYGMLETAASDIYKQCGLRRVICVSRIHEFIVPHLANKYFDRLGIAVEELDLQVRALRDIHCQQGWRGTLVNPETQAYEFRWSKNLYEKADDALLRAVPASARRILSIGVGAGDLERQLHRSGLDVQVVALDEVFARVLRQRGVPAVTGPLDRALASIGDDPFDAVLVVDALHLVADPRQWLRAVRERLSPGGHLIVRVDNTGEIPAWLADLRGGRRRTRFPRFAASGVQPINPAVLRRWCRATGFTGVRISPVMADTRRQKMGPFAVGPIEAMVATQFILEGTVPPAASVR